MDSAIQLLNNWGLVFHWWLRNRMNYLRRLPLQIWKRPSPANPHCKKPTSQKRKEKLWKKGSPFPHRGWVDGELIRNATYRSYETKKYFKTSCAPYRIAWTACCKLEDAVVSHVKNTHPELQTLPQNWRAPSPGFCTWTHNEAFQRAADLILHSYLATITESVYVHTLPNFWADFAFTTYIWI